MFPEHRGLERVVEPGARRGQIPSLQQLHQLRRPTHAAMQGLRMLRQLPIRPGGGDTKSGDVSGAATGPAVR